MMMTDPLRILFSSDHHFGVPNIDQHGMASAYANTVFPILETADAYFINGDFFDQLIQFDSGGFDPIYEVIVSLFQICEQKQIVLRILQGTWTHDRNQLSRLVTFYKKGGYGGYTFNFRFVEGIDLEEVEIKGRRLRILYVQDDLPYKSSEDVLEVIRQKLTEKGWDSVDYACMHGFFDHTFPKNVSQDNVIVYKESQFPFVKKAIDCGHVHQFGAWDKLLSNGSFDRTVFGDEDPKGFIEVLDYHDKYTARFIENEQAAVYDTLLITKDDTTETIVEKTTRHVESLSTERKISLRFVVDKPEHRDAIKTWMKEAYPNIRFQFKKSKDVDHTSLIMTSSCLLTPVEKRIAPTPATIATFVRSHIPDKYPLSTDDIEAYLVPVNEQR